MKVQQVWFLANLFAEKSVSPKKSSATRRDETPAARRMFTVFDEEEVDLAAEKSDFKKIRVSLREEGRLASYVRWVCVSVLIHF